MALLNFRESSLFTDAEKVALELAEAMTSTPTRVTDELLQRVRQHYSEEQVVEMAANICLENWRARFNRCFDIQAIGQYTRLPELMEAAGLPMKKAQK